MQTLRWEEEDREKEKERDEGEKNVREVIKEGR